MKIITPVETNETNTTIKEGINDMKVSVFLAGTIDNGDSSNWQEEVIKELNNYNLPNLTIYNPRRKNWDKNASEKDQIEQINWEQKYLKESDAILMVLLDNSKSPISLMELGQYSSSGKIIVFCTENFYRYCNVKILCDDKNLILRNTNDPKEIADIVLIGMGLKTKE